MRDPSLKLYSTSGSTSEKVLMWDMLGGSNVNSTFVNERQNHKKDGGNVLYWDGHAGWMNRTNWFDGNHPKDTSGY